jgi:hypothetical protein
VKNIGGSGKTIIGLLDCVAGTACQNRANTNHQQNPRPTDPMLVILVGPYAGQLVVFAHVFSHSVSQVCFAGLSGYCAPLNDSSPRLSFLVCLPTLLITKTKSQGRNSTLERRPLI